ncbi:MAG: rhodanese-like domain-containing protein [Pelagibacteraceae bacterium]|jgi:rhodanese-related sulfurtransferase|nr:rhodanese-like domain-containing protein [Pelagibacteraceae bacterium]|tara:strand:+ start:457 stop:849 length:393 start_codon:yes stop_codon:yes gene_type:complete
MKFKTSKELVQEAMDKVKTITPLELSEMQKKNKELILIDIRDIRELKKTGKIKGAKHMPRGMLEFWLDPESPYYKKDISPDKTKVFYCASNWRSALATKSIQEMGFENVYHVEGGFQAIVDSGYEVEKID